MRIALGIEYEGQHFVGFQRQPHMRTVQGELEKALSIIADENISLQCAGRTDTGVNATGQVVHFDVTKERADRGWILGTNNFLPQDVAVLWARHVDEGFHARFSATARRYRYILKNAISRGGIMPYGVSIYPGEFDVELMQKAADFILGERDFSSFRAAEDASRTSMRCVHFLKISRYGEYLIFDIAANAFLMHMVRNIVGSLLLVGRHERDLSWFQKMFLAKDRTKAGPTAKPQGLYLVDVTYPSVFNLPKREFIGPLFLP